MILKPPAPRVTPSASLSGLNGGRVVPPSDSTNRRIAAGAVACGVLLAATTALFRASATLTRPAKFEIYFLRLLTGDDNAEARGIIVAAGENSSEMPLAVFGSP